MVLVKGPTHAAAKNIRRPWCTSRNRHAVSISGSCALCFETQSTGTGRKFGNTVEKFICPISNPNTRSTTRPSVRVVLSVSKLTDGCHPPAKPCKKASPKRKLAMYHFSNARCTFQISLISAYFTPLPRSEHSRASWGLRRGLLQERCAAGLVEFRGKAM